MRINTICNSLAVLILSGFSPLTLAADFSLGYELGTSFGGEEVAENDNGGLGGDNYNAGGGAILAITGDFAMSERLNARALAGYRYQGGDGSNSGVVLEGSAVYQIADEFFAGVGFHGDMANEVETATGETIEFETAIGPMVMAEWLFTPQLGLGTKYIQMDYETNNGVAYEGDQGTIYVRMNSL